MVKYQCTTKKFQHIKLATSQHDITMNELIFYMNKYHIKLEPYYYNITTEIVKRIVISSYEQPYYYMGYLTQQADYITTPSITYKQIKEFLFNIFYDNLIKLIN
jgi:hypothetical protein